MPAAHGIVRSVDNARVSADFTLEDGTQVLFSCALNPAIEDFECKAATLHYEYPGDLTSTHQWNGRVGINGIKFTFDNGPTVTGQLDTPANPATRVAGSATWTHRGGGATFGV